MDWPLTARAICLWRMVLQRQHLSKSRRAECKAPLPPGWLILLDWPLTARAICLWRITAAATSMNSRRAECEAPLPPGWLILGDWPLTVRATCLRRMYAASGNIYEFTPGGVQSTFASGLSAPNELAFNSAGDLFVADGAADNIMNSRRTERKAPLPPGWITRLDWPSSPCLNPRLWGCWLLAPRRSCN